MHRVITLANCSEALAPISLQCRQCKNFRNQLYYHERVQLSISKSETTKTTTTATNDKIRVVTNLEKKVWKVKLSFISEQHVGTVKR